MAPTGQTMQSSAASNSAQGSSSSALVLEFMCLFTHDLKRKQKRWQDGRLKFHAFNKRIMVYDERGNFIGDTHWREDYDFGDGDEVQLERGGVIVQAAECLATHSQDLSELIDKRVQEKVQRQSAAAAARQQRPTPSRGVPVAPQAATPHFQLRHTPLHNLLGTPTGHHGRALAPTESPFEERQRVNAQQSPNQQDKSPRPAKKRRMEVSPPSKSGYAQSLFGTTLTLSGRPMSSAPVRHRPHHSQVHRRDPIPPSSSDLSNLQDQDDQVRQVSPPAEPTTQSCLPLSENRTAGNNIPKALPDALVGKDARSRANVPPLLHQTRHPAVKPVAETIVSTRPPVKVPSKADRLLDTGDHSDPPPVEQSMTKSRRKKRGADEPHNLDQLPQKSLKDRNRVTIVEDLETASITPASIQSNEPTHKSPDAQGARKTLYKALNEPEIPVPSVVEKPAARPPRIELRVAPSKKRGLLMLSEKSNAKKTRKLEKSISCDNSEPSGVSELEVIDLNDTSLPTTKKSSSKSRISNPATKERLNRHAHQDQHSSDASNLATIDLSEELNTAPDTDGTTDAPVPDERRSRVTSNATLTQQRLREDEEKQPRFAHQPIEETIHHTRTRKKLGNPVENPKQNLSSAHQDYATYTMDESESEVAAVGYSEADSYQDSHYASRNMKDYERDFEELLSKRPDNAPPPRLAQFPRKSVRSREIIGLFYEDNDTPRFQSTNDIQPIQRSDSGPRHRPAATTGSFTKDDRLTNSIQADGKATPEITAPLAQQHRISSEVRADMMTHQIKPTKPATKKTAPSPPEKSQDSDQQNLPSSGQSDILASMNLGLSSQQMHASSKLSAPPAAERNDEALVVVEKTQDSSAGHTRTSPSNNKDKAAPGQCTSFSEALSGTGRGKPSRFGQRPPRSVSDLSLDVHMPENDVQKEDQVVGTAVTSRAPVPRIVNPATRGKKAAKPSDAAGQIPDIILPSDDRALARAGTKLVNAPPNALPGFSKANGGPWSREAYDLFEFRRPG